MESHDTDLERELRQALIAVAEPVRGDGVRQDVVRQTVVRRRRIRRTVHASLVGAAAAAAVAVGLLVSSGGEDRVRTVDRPPSTSTPAVTAEPEPDESPDRPATSSSSSTTPQDSNTTTSLTPAPPSSTTTSSTTTEPPPLPEFPPALVMTQGGNAWAVYLAVVPSDESGGPEHQAAEAARAEAGYEPASGELGCDQGAAEALGRDPSSAAVGVYFESQAQAEQARAAFQARDHPVVGVVQVRTYCAD